LATGRRPLAPAVAHSQTTEDAATVGRAEVSGTAWLDLNLDGIRQPDEATLARATVRIDRVDLVERGFSTTFTDDNGRFSAPVVDAVNVHCGLVNMQRG